MTLLMRDREKYNEGLKQGIEQGIEQGKKSTVISLIKAGVSIERIAEALGLSVDQVKIIVS
jgi:predicted transposase/invertase (TIGR01784 family)